MSSTIRDQMRSNLIGYAAGMATALSLFATAEAAASRYIREAPRVVSGPSPNRDGCAGPGSTATDAQGEPSLAVDPADRRHLVTAWKEDVSASDSLTVAAAASFDGGRSWRRTRLPGGSACDGGPAKYTHATDPWVSIGPRGVVWIASLPFTNANPGAVAVNRSTDGGRTWSPASFVDKDNLPTEFDDKETIAADPSDPMSAYVVWVKEQVLPPPLPGAPFASTIYFSRTRDGGRSWSARQALASSPLLELAGPQNIVALPGGDLLVVYGRHHPDNPLECLEGECPTTVTLYAIRSSDGGQTWSAPSRIGAFHDQNPQIEGAGTLTAPSAIFSLAIGRTGTAWIATHTEPQPGTSRLLLFRSGDGGNSWSELPDIPVGQGLKLQPTIAASRGRLAISWFDFRDDRPGGETSDFSWWFAHSHDGGASWREKRLAGPSDLRAAPGGGALIGDHFLGHYFGLQPIGRNFIAAITLARPLASHGPTDIFSTRLRAHRKRIHLSVRPHASQVGTRTTFRFKARVRRGGKRRALPGARIHFAGRATTTGRDGRGRIARRFWNAGRRHASACKRGYSCGRAVVRVVG